MDILFLGIIIVVCGWKARGNDKFVVISLIFVGILAILVGIFLKWSDSWPS